MKLVILVLIYLVYISPANARPVTEAIQPCSDVVEFKGLAYFCADQSNTGRELFVSNGGRLSATPVVDLIEGAGSSHAGGAFELNGFLFFFAESQANGGALYRTDGTAEGTKLIKPFLYEYRNSDFTFLRSHIVGVVGDVSYIELSGIVAGDGSILIQTDGTFLGTKQIDVPLSRGFVTNGFNGKPSSYTVFNGQFFVLSQLTLYRILDDGSSQVVKEFVPSQSPPSILSNTQFLNKFVISAYRGTLGTFVGEEEQFETWLSDGTPMGTALFKSGVHPVGSVGQGLLVYESRPASGYSQASLLKTNGELVDLGVRAPQLSGYEINVDPRKFNFGDKVVFPGDGFAELNVTDGTPDGTHSLSIEYFDYEIFRGYIHGASGDSDAWVKSNGSSEQTEVVTPGDFSSFFAVSGQVFAQQQVGSSLVVFQPDSGSAIKVGTAPFFRESNPFNIFRYSNVYREGQRIFIRSVTDTEPILFHSDGTVAGTYVLSYSFDDGRPLVELNRGVLLPMIDLLMDDEEDSP